MFDQIIALENLLVAWTEFVRGKRDKPDVGNFAMRLIDNIMVVREDLATGRWQHGPYQAFTICDPKPRQIHKATVRDRLLHHAMYRILYPVFAKKFIADSYSCQNRKGTHRALARFRQFGAQASRNHIRSAWVLQCDIRKFFASIDQKILMRILRSHLKEEKVLRLLNRVTTSFSSTDPGKGLPLGNLTSQLLVNIYLHEFDLFVKHWLKARWYLRYADDFVILSADRAELERRLEQIKVFLCEKLALTLHPNKVTIKTLASGVDFLGWVHFSDHRVLRTTTKRRMFKRARSHPTEATIASYRGLLSHGNTHQLLSELPEAIDD